jgi:hypothetical protein
MSVELKVCRFIEEYVNWTIVFRHIIWL